jgi:hypothetical protein
MNVRSLAVLILLFLTVTGCRSFSSQLEPSPSTPATATTEEVTVVPIGLIQRQVDIVEHGSGGVQYLSVLAEQAELFANDAVRVSGGGEALLNFGDALRLTLFNDSQLGISLEPAPDTPPIVQFYLFYGGFLGNKQPNAGEPVQVTTPAGAEITVTGTQFFVTYDPNSGETVAGNFDGSVELDMASGSQSLSRGHYVMISSSGEASSERPFFQTAEDFANAARSMRSIHSAVDALLLTPTPTSTGQLPPSSTPTPTVTDTPGAAAARAVYVLQANCRQGPNLAWEAVTAFQAGVEVAVTGRTADNGWYRIQVNRITCWSAASVLRVENGHLAPIIDVPPPPTPTWTPTTPLTDTPSPTPSPTATPTLTMTPTSTEPATPTATATETPNPPAAPVNLDVSANCTAPWEVEIFWTDVADNEEGYIVYRALWNGQQNDWAALELMTDALPPDSEYFVDSNGYSSRTLYRIGAFNKAGTGWASIEKGYCLG